MVKQIFDNKIDDTKLIEIKIPVNFPTITNWTDYAVVTGQIQLKDAYYNYVRLKMTTDTMYFICLPNAAKTRLVKANIIAAKDVSDVPISKKGQDAGVKKVNSLSEYNLQSFKYSCTRFGITLPTNNRFVNLQITHPFIESPGKPPNFTC